MKKRQIICSKCENPCNIYKRGKKEKLIYCPNCGVIAHNPKPFRKALLKRGARAVIGEIPGASALMEGVGLAGDLKSSKKESTYRLSESGKPTRSERIINKELYGE